MDRRVDGEGEIEPVGIELVEQLREERFHAVGLRLAGPLMGPNRDRVGKSVGR